MRRGRHRLFIGVLCVASLAGFSACGDDDSATGREGGGESAAGGDEGAENSDGAADPVEVKIASILPISGNLAAIGEEATNGVRLGVDVCNETQDAVRLSLETYDSQNKPEEAVALFNKAVAEDGVQAIVGPMTTGEIQAVKPVAERLETPFFMPGGATSDLTDDAEYAFRTTASNDAIAAQVVRFATEDLGLENLAVVVDSGGFGQDFLRGLEEEGFDAAATTEEFELTATDLSAQVAAVRNSGADGVLLGTTAAALNGLFIDTMASSGMDIPVVGPASIISGDVLQVAGDVLDEVPVYGAVAVDTTKPEYEELLSRYTEEFGDPAADYFVVAYDAARVICDAFASVEGAAEGAELVSAIEEVEYVGVAGRQGSTEYGFAEGDHNALHGEYLVWFKLTPDGPVQLED